MGTDYRAGLPPIEAAAAHEERTQHAQWMRRRPATADCPIASTPEITALPTRHWSYILSSGEDYAKWEFCPVSDDGEMMPWPGGPDPVDSLRKALAISDERCREQAGEIERLTEAGAGPTQIRVEQGSIHINSIGYLARHADSFVLECDAEAKRYEVTCIDSASDGWHAVEVDRTPETLHAEESTEPTTIKFHLAGKWWISAVTTGRYSTLIYGVRRMSDAAADELKGLWSDRSGHG